MILSFWNSSIKYSLAKNPAVSPYFLQHEIKSLSMAQRPSRSDTCWLLPFHVPTPILQYSHRHHFFTYVVPSAWDTYLPFSKGFSTLSHPHLLPLPLSGSLCATPVLTPLEQVVHYIIIICLMLCLPKQSMKFWKAKTRSLISVSSVNTGLCNCLWNKQILPFCFIYNYEHVL